MMKSKIVQLAADTVANSPPEDDAVLWRLPQVLKHYPVSRSNWYAGVLSGRYPAGIKLSERVIAWRSSAIRKLIAEL